ncbi:MAG: hypothetical protein ABEN55_10900, partial [Bradymonadaceae bacterium]
MKKETEIHTDFLDMYDTDGSSSVPSSHFLKMGGDTHAMEKVASQDGGHVPDKIERAIRSLQQSHNPDKAYLYDRALGAGEVYGPNSNADWFGEFELQNRHPTFERCAHVYRHHDNKDPSNSV